MNGLHPNTEAGLPGERYFQGEPHLALAPYIHSYAVVEVPDSGQINPFGRMVPDGIIKLVFHFGDQFLQNTPEGPELQERSFLHGHLPSYLEIAPSGCVGLISVNFYAHGLAAFTKVPLHELGEQRITPEDLWGQEGRELQARVCGADTHTERYKVINAFFVTQLQNKLTNVSLMGLATQWVWQQQGQISVKAMAQVFGKSSRTLERYFATHLGVTPKYLARIFRIHQLIHRYQQQPNLSLMDLTHLGGYFDQSHFYGDFQRLTGVSPKVVLNRKATSKVLFLNQSLADRMVQQPH